MLSNMTRIEDKVGITMVQVNRDVFRVSKTDKINNVFEIHSLSGAVLSTDTDILEMVSGKENISGEISRTDDNKTASVKIN